MSLHLPGKPQGFTLIEILVALSVFSIMSVLTYGGMSRVFFSRDIVDERSQSLQQMQMAFTVIKNDLEQAINRSSRDRLGGTLPAFESKKDADILLALTTQPRSGWQLQSGVSFLERVEYRNEDNQLIRDVWPVLDRAHDSEAESSVLLKDVDSIELEFISLQEHEFWPLPNGHAEYRQLPRGVRLTLHFTDDSSIERLFTLAHL